MSGRIDAKLKELNITLPEPPKPVANYVPWLRTGNYIYISGQIPTIPKGAVVGVVGDKLKPAQAAKAAQICALNILAVLNSALDGDLDRVKRCVKLTGYINAAPGFGQHPEIMNAASNVMVQVFGEAGKHTRSAVGAGTLPRGVPVEIDAVFEVE
ncbi:MAG: RidA family protein [Alphaproteobacteria bacterium]